MSDSASHAGRRYVVTGAASGIGLAFARLAVSRQARVCLLDIDAGALELACRELGGVPGFVCDVADSKSVQSAIERSADALGGLDGVVNSAGVDLYKPIEEISDADWSRLLAVNLTGPMYVCRSATPWLKRAGGGSIVNVSSAAGLAPLANRSGYCAVKAGLNMFGKALALELGSDNIRVATVCPGAVDTPLLRSSYETAQDPQAELERVRQRYALGRIALPAELAEAILYLSGSGASYITGATLAVDGGRSFY